MNRLTGVHVTPTVLFNVSRLLICNEIAELMNITRVLWKEVSRVVIQLKNGRVG